MKAKIIQELAYAQAVLSARGGSSVASVSSFEKARGNALSYLKGQKKLASGDVLDMQFTYGSIRSLSDLEHAEESVLAALDTLAVYQANEK